MKAVQAPVVAESRNAAQGNGFLLESGRQGNTAAYLPPHTVRAGGLARKLFGRLCGLALMGRTRVFASHAAGFRIP